MATFKINGKNFATQDGTGAATVHSDVVFPAGHVVQTVTASVNETVSTTSTSFTHASQYDLTITPKFNNSKFRLHWSGSTYVNSNNAHGYVTFYRDSTNLGHSTEGLRLYQVENDSSGARWQISAFDHIDTPNDGTAAIAEIVYKVYFRTTAGTGRLNYDGNYYSTSSVQEIKV